MGKCEICEDHLECFEPNSEECRLHTLYESKREIRAIDRWIAFVSERKIKSSDVDSIARLQRRLLVLTEIIDRIE